MAVSFGIEVEGAFRYRFARNKGWNNSTRDQYDYLVAYLRKTGEKIAESDVDGAVARAQPLLNAWKDGYGHGDFSEGQGWKVTTDVSVRDDRNHSYGGSTGGYTFEIVSPVLSGKHALDQCSDLLRALVASGAYIGRNSGQHVHFGVMDKSWFSWNKFGPFANNLNDIYAHFINVMNGFQPKSRRERCVWIQMDAHDDQPPFGNSAAYFLNLKNEENLRGIQNRRMFRNGAYSRFDNPDNAASAIWEDVRGRTNENWRYKIVNWTTSMWRNGTVEFRQGMPTMSPLHTIRWVRLLRRMYTWAYAPEYREGGKYYEKPLEEYDTTVDALMDILRVSASERRYWNARFDWYAMSKAQKITWATRQGGISRNNTESSIITKGRTKWFVDRNANQY